MPIKILLIPAIVLTAFLFAAQGNAQGLAIDLTLAKSNPSAPKMGNHLAFESVITNTGSRPVEGLIAWISLVRVDPGQEQPMDLEDWSAHKAVTETRVGPGRSIRTKWPMRLIQAGDYRVVISAVGRNVDGLATSPFVGFTVLPKPVVESSRILPVAFGVPLAIGTLLIWRLWRPRLRASRLEDDRARSRGVAASDSASSDSGVT